MYLFISMDMEALLTILVCVTLLMSYFFVFRPSLELLSPECIV